MVDLIEAKVASGEYATESEVVSDGLRKLKARDVAIDRWLLDEVVASWDEYQADLSIAIPAGEVSARLDARREARLAKPKSAWRLTLFSRPAHFDISKHFDYIADHGDPVTARKYVRRLEDACRSLGHLRSAARRVRNFDPDRAYSRRGGAPRSHFRSRTPAS